MTPSEEAAYADGLAAAWSEVARAAAARLGLGDPTEVHQGRAALRSLAIDLGLDPLTSEHLVDMVAELRKQLGASE